MNNVVKIVLYALALAMGVSVIVMNIVSPPSLTTVSTLLGLGLAALGLAGLQQQR